MFPQLEAPHMVVYYKYIKMCGRCYLMPYFDRISIIGSRMDCIQL